LPENPDAADGGQTDPPGSAAKRALRPRRAGAREKHGPKHDRRLLLRSDCAFPTLYQIRRWGLFTTPIAYATAHMAALFVKHFPREEPGVFAPETLPAEIRREILAGVCAAGFRLTHKVTPLKPREDEEF